MSHYDCKNCGHHLGIDWGLCEKCTPKEYLELEQLRKCKVGEIVDREVSNHRKYAMELAHLLTKDIRDRMKQIRRDSQ